MDGRSKPTICKRNNSRLLDTAFEMKPIKEKTKGHFLTSQMHTSTREILSNMSSFTSAATNASTTATSLTWNQEIYNKIICRNNKTKDWASKMDRIIQAIEAMAGLKEKAEELIRIADIINNTMADVETLLAREGYRMDIATQFYEVAEILRLILHDTLPQRFHSIQCNLVNKLTICQGQGHPVIDNHIRGLQELFANTNRFTSLPRVKPTVPPRENNKEEEEVILIRPSPPPNDKSTTTLLSNESMASASENSNTQLSEEIDNLITSLK